MPLYPSFLPFCLPVLLHPSPLCTNGPVYVPLTPHLQITSGKITLNRKHAITTPYKIKKKEATVNVNHQLFTAASVLICRSFYIDCFLFNFFNNCISFIQSFLLYSITCVLPFVCRFIWLWHSLYPSRAQLRSWTCHSTFCGHRHSSKGEENLRHPLIILYTIMPII